MEGTLFSLQMFAELDNLHQPFKNILFELSKYCEKRGQLHDTAKKKTQFVPQRIYKRGQ